MNTIINTNQGSFILPKENEEWFENFIAQNGVNITMMLSHGILLPNPNKNAK